MNEMNSTLERVCRLPIDFHTVGNKSLLQLLADAEYTNDPDDVGVSDIQRCLSDHDDWCDAWLGYSQDRRTSCGWVISEDADGFVVFYYPNGNERLKFKDKAGACAAFAIRELWSLIGRTYRTRASNKSLENRRA